MTERHGLRQKFATIWGEQCCTGLFWERLEISSVLHMCFNWETNTVLSCARRGTCKRTSVVNTAQHSTAWHSRASESWDRLGQICKTEFWMQAQEWLAHPLEVPWLAAHVGQLGMSPEAQAAPAGPRAFWHCKPGDCHRGWSTALPPLQQEKWSARYPLNILICQGLIGVGACFALFWGRKFWLQQTFYSMFCCLAIGLDF